VILSGVSGTGKTWLAEEYADAIGGEKLLVPVAPNWTTNEDLLGYQNPLNDDYHHTSFSNFLKSASSEWKSCQDTGIEPRPYFLILDEMNLARIEFYFALFLSKLEVMHRGGRPMIELGAESVELTPNLKVIGTINVDETTQMFSDKVYDRAQLIELPVSRVEINTLIGDKPYRQDLLKVWDAVSEIAPFAYRVIVDIEAYWEQALSVGNSSEEALDEQLLQKVLPKIKGMDPRIKASLESISEITRDKYQLTFEKTQVMLDSFTQNGIASYFA
jgi:MoxR-like ATPase